jgi:hypothetical protein
MSMYTVSAMIAITIPFMPPCCFGPTCRRAGKPDRGACPCRGCNVFRATAPDRTLPDLRGGNDCQQVQPARSQLRYVQLFAMRHGHQHRANREDAET